MPHRCVCMGCSWELYQHANYNYCNLCTLDTNNGNKFGNNSHCLSDRSEVTIFVYLNARSLVHKHDGLRAVAEVSKICLIESWLQLSTNIYIWGWLGPSGDYTSYSIDLQCMEGVFVFADVTYTCLNHCFMHLLCNWLHNVIKYLQSIWKLLYRTDTAEFTTDPHLLQVYVDSLMSF